MSALTPDLIQSIERYKAKARAENTARAYDSQMRHFLEWCGKNGLEVSFPVPGPVMAAFLVSRADTGAAISTIEVAYAALRAAHIERELDFDMSIAKQVLQGIRRSLVREQRQVAPLHGGLLRAILSEPPRDIRDVRNQALLGTTYAFGLRRAEAAALDFLERCDGAGVLSIHGDRVDITLFGSKANPSKVEKLTIDRGRNPLVSSAIERWIEVAGLERGRPFLRRLLKGQRLGGRLAGASLAPLVQEAIRRHLVGIGMPLAEAADVAAKFAAHSGRVGLAVASAEAGVPDTAIQAATRHRDLRSVARYARQADGAARAPDRWPGVGL